VLEEFVCSGNDWNAEVYEVNRMLVRRSIEKERAGVRMYQADSNSVIGCSYLPDGRYRKYYLKNDYENIARYICSSEELKILCSASDEALACTMGSFLDLAVPSFKDVIIPYLEKCQCSGEEKVFECVD